MDGDGRDELLVADLGDPAAFDGIRVVVAWTYTSATKPLLWLTMK